MSKSDLDRINHIKTHCETVEELVERFGDDYNTFISDKAYYNAVAMCILQIGELSNGLTESFRDATKDQMPWGLIRGMRNWIAHGYTDMDKNTIWETAISDLPKLLEFCKKVISNEPSLFED